MRRTQTIAKRPLTRPSRNAGSKSASTLLYYQHCGSGRARYAKA
ncbi:MAG: hypothetical protein ACM31E_04110 [Fibrobacterota bacterium]